MCSYDSESFSDGVEVGGLVVVGGLVGGYFIGVVLLP